MSLQFAFLKFMNINDLTGFRCPNKQIQCGFKTENHLNGMCNTHDKYSCSD